MSPSISVRSWLITLSVTLESPIPIPLLGTRESNSSKNTMLGAAILAFLNISLIAFSDSPTHLLKISGPLTEMKFASDSVATALASRVFPQPGGPWSRMPFGGSMPSLLNMSGFFMGHSTASIRLCFTSSSPPTSSQLTFGVSMKTSLIAVGVTSLKASRMSSLLTSISSRTSWGILFSSRSIWGRYLLRAFMAASLLRASRSAPVYPWVISETWFRLTSSERGIPLVWICIISSLPPLSGIPISISLSNLPGLLRASSMASGLLVAPMTMTCPLPLRPSIEARSWATTLRSTSPVTSLLFGAMASSSSMKRMLGAFFSASSNILRILASDSP